MSQIARPSRGDNKLGRAKLRKVYVLFVKKFKQ